MARGPQRAEDAVQRMRRALHEERQEALSGSPRAARGLGRTARRTTLCPGGPHQMLVLVGALLVLRTADAQCQVLRLVGAWKASSGL